MRPGLSSILCRWRHWGRWHALSTCRSVDKKACDFNSACHSKKWVAPVLHWEVRGWFAAKCGHECNGYSYTRPEFVALAKKAQENVAELFRWRRRVGFYPFWVDMHVLGFSDAKEMQPELWKHGLRASSSLLVFFWSVHKLVGGLVAIRLFVLFTET